MKKGLIILSIVAAEVIALAGCQKEYAFPVKTHKVTIFATQEGSRTSVTEEDGKAIFDWTDEDMGNFHVFENGKEATSTVAEHSDGKVTIFAEFADLPADEYVYTAFLAGATVQEGASPAIFTVQTVGTQLYASSADILVAKPQVSATTATSLNLAFKRVVALSKMTVKNIPAGEVVQKLIITADKPIAGHFDMADDAWVSSGDAIDVIVGKTVSAGDSIVVGFVSAPVEDATFSVKVITDKKNLGKTFARTLSLPEGRMVAYKVNMSGCEIPLFYESFDLCDGTGGNDGSWSGSVAGTELSSEKLDNAGWSWANGYKAKKCVKLGTGSKMGTITTPALGLKTGQNAKLSFKAGAWNTSSESTRIALEIIGNGVLGENEFFLKKGAWTDFSLVISGGDANTRLKISAQKESSNRFFLDELKVENTTGGGGGKAADAGWMELPAKAVSANQYYGVCTADGVRNYSYLYDKTRYAALWVAYPLCKSNTSGYGHSSGWRWNPDIEQQYQINVKDKAYGTNYGDGTYARGHQIPNADRKDSDNKNTQTYYLTNQTPQIQNGFNSGVWNTLEGDIRSLLSSTDTVYVITGPTYEKVGETKAIKYLTATSTDIKPSSVPVPNYYWKVLLKVKRTGGTVTSACAIGVWLEHKAYSTGTTWTSYVTSVDQIEHYTGFDLFANLPASVASTAEANSSWSTFSNF